MSRLMQIKISIECYFVLNDKGNGWLMDIYSADKMS